MNRFSNACSRASARLLVVCRLCDGCGSTQGCELARSTTRENVVCLARMTFLAGGGGGQETLACSTKKKKKRRDRLRMDRGRACGNASPSIHQARSLARARANLLIFTRRLMDSPARVRACKHALAPASRAGSPACIISVARNSSHSIDRDLGESSEPAPLPPSIRSARQIVSRARASERARERTILQAQDCFAAAANFWPEKERENERESSAR